MRSASVTRLVCMWAVMLQPTTVKTAAPYYEEHPSMGTGPDARRTERFQVERAATTWRVRQVIEDPDGFDEWAIVLEVDLGASDEVGAAVVRPLALERL